MLTTAALRWPRWLSSHRQQRGDEAIEIDLLAADAHDPRRSGTRALTSPLSLGLAPPHDLRAAPGR
ncbi:MAG TPA: hypothetical protein VEB65_10895 [Solirubrobacterales bacterium]|nr:hypothetical protein [Solirubrobacterales bacterium]